MILEINNLSAAYGQLQVLWGISLEVSEKEMVSLIGANGAGKSTLLKSVIGVVKPLEGTVLYKGESVLGKPPHRLVRSGISYVPEGRRLFPTMNVKENLRMGAERNCPNIEQRMEKVCNLFPALNERKSQAAGTLSGGEQQMVAIGRAMMSEPKLLLLDELSFGLSPIMFERVLSAIETIRDSGVSILLAEQNAVRALEVSDRAYVMENGRFALSGKSTELMDDPKVRDAYLGVAEEMAVGSVDVLQALLNGLLQGGFLALAAIGLSLIYGVQKILNIAHGALMILAAFITIQFSILVTPRLHLNPLLSLPFDFIILALVGVVAYFALIYKTENKGFEGPLLATFGLSVFLEYVISSGLVIPLPGGGLTLIPSIDPSYGNGAQPQNQDYSGGALHFGSIYIQEPQLIAFIIAIAIIPLLQLFLSRTYYGNAIRATAQDWEAAEFSGVDIRRARLLSFSLGAGLAGVAGGMFAFTNTITATEADVSLLPIVLAIIILGGVGSILGTLFGGLIVGLIISMSDFVALEVLTKYSFPSDFGLLLTYLIFLAVLMIKPTGSSAALGNRKQGIEKMTEIKVEPPAKQSSRRTKLSGIFRSQNTISPLLVAIGLLMAFVYPLFLGSGEQGSLGIIVIYFIWIILAESWNLVGGYAGLINLGMVAFFGLGSVVTSIVLTAGLGFGVAILASALVGAIFALILTPTFRLRTDYFAIATLVIPIVLKPIENILPAILNFELPPGLAVNQTLNYEVGVALTALTIFGIYFLMRSRIGMALRGIGDDEFASATVGVNVLLIKTTALVASGVIAAVAGSYYLTYILAVNTSIFLNLTFSLYPIFMVIIGGIGTFEGPVVGALLFSAITYEVNSYFPSSDIEVLIFSVVIMAVAWFFLPKGLVPSIRKFVVTRQQRKNPEPL